MPPSRIHAGVAQLAEAADSLFMTTQAQHQLQALAGKFKPTAGFSLLLLRESLTKDGGAKQVQIRVQFPSSSRMVFWDFVVAVTASDGTPTVRGSATESHDFLEDHS